MKVIGPQGHGPTNVLQVTFVFTPDGVLKAASGYQRDPEGKTWGQWRSATGPGHDGPELTKEVLEYLRDTLADPGITG